MLAKGKNQHVLPDGEGWCVIDEVNQMLVLRFSTREEAMAHASEKAYGAEGSVLIHTDQCHVGPFSSVSLPQEHLYKDECSAKPRNVQRSCSDFDPFLGFDEYYFEI